jgi:hypothetical protein
LLELRKADMSLPPDISGFSLKELFSLRGAKGREALPELEAKLSFRDPARTQEAHAILQRAIDESDRWADLEVETEMHVAVARVLAGTVTVVLRVLESISADEGASCLAVARGLCSTIHAANNAEAMANWDTPKPARTKFAGSEEKAWQEAALSLIDSWKGVGTRTMFDLLEGKPPRWLLDWRARCKEHLHEPGDP